MQYNDGWKVHLRLSKYVSAPVLRTKSGGFVPWDVKECAQSKSAQWFKKDGTWKGKREGVLESVTYRGRDPYAALRRR